MIISGNLVCFLLLFLREINGDFSFSILVRSAGESIIWNIVRYSKAKRLKSSHWRRLINDFEMLTIEESSLTARGNKTTSYVIVQSFKTLLRWLTCFQNKIQAGCRRKFFTVERFSKIYLRWKVNIGLLSLTILYKYRVHLKYKKLGIKLIL